MKKTLVILSLLISFTSTCFATENSEDCWVEDFTDLSYGIYTASDGFSVDFNGDNLTIKINGVAYNMHNIQCSFIVMPETALMNFSITYYGTEYPAQLEDVQGGGKTLYYY